MTDARRPCTGASARACAGRYCAAPCSRRHRPFAGWTGTTCLVTGGLGFIGSNLVRALVDGGARVRVVDALVPGHGGRADQLDGVDVESVLIVASIADPACRRPGRRVRRRVQRRRSGQPQASMRDPQQDLAAQRDEPRHVARHHPTRAARGDASSTRRRARCTAGRRCRPSTRPTPPARSTSTASPSWPASSSTSSTATPTASPATALRLTNVYGPRQRLTSDELGFLPVFVRKALLGRGRSRSTATARNAATACMSTTSSPPLAAATDDRAVGQVFNVGHPDTHTVAEIAERSPTRPAVTAAYDSSTGRTTGADRHRLVPHRQRPHRRGARLAGDDRPRRGLCSTPSASTGSIRGTCRRPEPPRRPLRRRASRRSPNASPGRGSYLLGDELESFERELAGWLGADHAAGVASGASALQLALTAAGIGAGDDVLVPAFTAVPTASAVVAAGATAGRRRRRSADRRASRRRRSPTRRTTRTRAVIVVHLYGLPGRAADVPTPLIWS